MQRAGEFTGARIGPGAADARRAGDRRGIHKAFTTQIAALSLLVIALGKTHGMDAEHERTLVLRLIELPAMIEKTLTLDAQIRKLAERFVAKNHALFLGRGALFPIALEGALKLKEIPTSMPRAMRRASSSTDRWRWWTRTCPWWPWRPTTICSRSSSPT